MFNKLFRRILKKNKSVIIYNRLEQMSWYFSDDIFQTELGDRRVTINTSEYPFSTISLVYYDYDNTRLFGLACDKDTYKFISFKNINEINASLALYEIEKILGIVTKDLTIPTVMKLWS